MTVFTVLVAIVLTTACGARSDSIHLATDRVGAIEQIPGADADRATRNASVAATEGVADSVGTVASSDGVEIRYEVAGRGEPALVFVHGWSCDRSYWSAQLDHFAESHRVVAIDLGGHGESGLGREEWTMAAFGEDVRAVVEELGLSEVVLVGHSMGGPVIVEAARRIPERVVAVVPVEMFWDVDDPMSAEAREEILASMRGDFPATTERFVRSMFPEDADPALVDRIARDIAAGPPEVGISAMAHILTNDEGAGLAAVEAPMRVINADFWPTDLDALRKHRPDVELAVMPGTSHFVMQEDPEEFNRLLARAVSDLVARSSTETP